MRLLQTRSVLLLISGVLSLSLVAPVEAAPLPVAPKPTIKIRTVDVRAVEARVESLQSEAADAAEEWNKARLELSRVESKIKSLKARSNAQADSYQLLSKDLGVLVRGLYKSGGIDLDLQAVVSADPATFLAHLDAVDIVGTRQEATLRRILAARTTLSQTNARLKAERAQAARIAKRAKGHLNTVNAKLAEAERLLNTLQEADRRKRAAQLAAKRKAQKAKSRSYSKNVSKVASKRVRVVLQYALSQLGDNYGAGGTGPSTYDCSGLTMMAYRRIGVSLSHYSMAQWSQTRRVSRSSLRPGDLVFFFKGIRHVGIYMGNNKFVHAASYKYGVIVSSLSEDYYRTRLSGFGRVIG